MMETTKVAKEKQRQKKQAAAQSTTNDGDSAGLGDFVALAPAAPKPQAKQGKSMARGKGKNRVKGKQRDKDKDGIPVRTSDVASRMNKYKRAVSVKGEANVKDKKIKGQLKDAKKDLKQAAYEAARAEILLPEQSGFLEAEGMEKTFKFRQTELQEHVDETSARKVFNLKLDTFGPYSSRYTHNGRHLLLGGRKGHVAAFDWQTGRMHCEMNLGETVRDITWLHNESMFAVAQKQNVYIYDNKGTEINFLPRHTDISCLDFLRYHFLLVSVGNAGWIKYHDVSTGQHVAEHRTKLGACKVMRQNPWNAVMACGHSNGVVTMWSPNSSQPLVKQLCHKSAVQALAINATGKFMATSAADGRLKIWDLRMFKDEPIHTYYSARPATYLDISHRDTLAVGFGGHIQLWKSPQLKKQKYPYMAHRIPGSVVRDMHFCPFEDVLGVGHAAGFSSILVPGSGEPNFDSLEANPYQTASQRRESEVKALLDKVPSQLIALDPHAILKTYRPTVSEMVPTDSSGKIQKFQPKFKKRGRSSTHKSFLRKQKNVVDQQKMARQELLAKRKQQHQRKVKPVGAALARF
eukprot:m.356247 g.356247  ORF g.356247 m.356247 type:complete len:577 (-) comp17484_c0_seq1:218-1948(-)